MCCNATVQTIDKNMANEILLAGNKCELLRQCCVGHLYSVALLYFLREKWPEWASFVGFRARKKHEALISF